MDIFNDKKAKQLEYLEEERKKVVLATQNLRL